MMTPTDVDTSKEYQWKRQNVFGQDLQYSQQLDNLWHDIDEGLLGEVAKTGSFYISIKAIKDKNPKPTGE